MISFKKGKQRKDPAEVEENEKKSFSRILYGDGNGKYNDWSVGEGDVNPTHGNVKVGGFSGARREPGCKKWGALF